MLENGADLCVNEGQKLSKYRVSLTEGKKKSKKEKSQFLTCLVQWEDGRFGKYD